MIEKSICFYFLFFIFSLSIKIKESQGEVCSTATWSKHGITVAGGKG
ncbi:unnamed protein product, partial [Adineta steineri]